MVIVFFCVSGTLSGLSQHAALTTQDFSPRVTRRLEADAQRFADTLVPFPGAVVVIANDWQPRYELEVLRRECGRFGRRVVGVLGLLSDRREEAIVEFASVRNHPYVILGSEDYEFADATADKRVRVDENGIDNCAAARLAELLSARSEDALRPVSEAELREVMVSTQSLRNRTPAALVRTPSDLRVREYLSHLPNRPRDGVVMQ